MSDIQQACLTALGDGPCTIDDLAEGTGHERLQVAQAMQALKQAGAVYSGRGGWRPVDESGEAPRLAANAVVTTEPENTAPPAPARRGRPRLATVAQITGEAPPRPASRVVSDDYAFAIGEAGILNVPPLVYKSGEGVLLKMFDDGAIAIIEKDTGQAMHLGPERALQLRELVAALDVLKPDPTSKPTNPKDAVGSDKLPIHLWPTTATIMGALGLLDGALKYGRSNFRAVGVRASIYYDAARRHLDAWFEGEDVDPDSKLPHHAHALACIAILVDAQAAGKLTDDRMYGGDAYRAFVREYTEHVARLKALHAGKSPQHYTIATDE